LEREVDDEKKEKRGIRRRKRGKIYECRGRMKKRTL